MQKTFTGLLPIFTVVLPSSPRQVDPDEDFAGGRRNEAKIYLVGGLIAVLVPLIGGIWACAGVAAASIAVRTAAHDFRPARTATLSSSCSVPLAV